MMATANDQSSSLSRYPLASFRELAALSLPLIFACLSANLLNLSSRLFLSHYSIEAWEAASASGSLAYFYQMSCSMIALIAQTFIGQHIGAKRLSRVGPIVWQVIWFAFLSMLITYPSSFYAELYFKGTEVETLALTYFRPLALFNFLFPLNVALTAFFLGRGQTRIIFYANISIQLLNIILDYFLIFGVGSILPPLGVFGASLAIVISTLTLSIVLFIKFLNPKHAPVYKTNQWRFNPQLFKEILKIGIPRSLGKAMVVGSWIFASHSLIKIGGDHLLTLTLGVSLFAVFTFMNEGMCQGLTTVASHIFGANREEAIPKLLRSAFKALALFMLLLSIPLIFMREALISLFISKSLSPETFELLKRTCIVMWICCFASGFNFIGASLITASRDTFFYGCVVSTNWLTICIPVYLVIVYFKCSPEYFFLIDAFNTTLFGALYFLRFKKGVWKRKLQSLHTAPLEA